MTRLCSVLFITVASLAFVLAASARPQGPKVVLIGPSSDQATVARVRDELRLLGFEVDVLVVTGPPADLATIGRQQQAAAVARVEEWPPEIVIWVNPEHELGSGQALEQAGTDRRAGKELQVSDSLTEPAEPELLAVRAVELLRGALLPVPQPVGTQPPSAGTAPAPSSSAADPSNGASPGGRDESPDRGVENGEGPHDSRTSFFLGPGLLVSPDGVPVTPHLLVGGSYRARWRLGVDARLVIPTTAGRVSAPEGSMLLRTLIMGAAATLQLTEPGSDWTVLTGLGMGAAHLWFEGEAVPPATAANGSTWAATPFAELSASYRLHPMLAMRGDTLASLLRPEPIVRIAGREVASVGQPALVLAIAIEVRP